MKNLLTIIGATATLGLAAQNANVVSAYNYMKDGNLPKAVEYIEPAILDAKTSVVEKTWRYRAEIYRLIALGEDAALKQQFPDALDRAAESYMKANELDEKGAYKRENSQALAALQGASLNAGNDAFTAKEYDRAIACYGRSEQIAKSFGQADTNAVFNSALAYEAKGDAAMAIERYKESIRIGYAKPEVYRYIASLQNKAGDRDAAIATTREGLTKYAGNKELMLDLITFLLAADKSDEAEAGVKAALEVDPGNAVLWSVLGGLYDKKASDAKDEAGIMGWYAKAEEAYKKSIEIDPKFFDAYFNIGVLYNNRAAFEYEKCNKLKSDAEYTKCKTAADAIYLKAVPFFEQAHALNPTDVQTMEQLKKLYAKTGDTVKYEQMKAKLGK
ncbi:MAG: tetratricopeptide repeat protein [Flavobacteriales bacterium]|nr:tetratricopeptide repeat protein [Flavobacteriales bacterium]